MVVVSKQCGELMIDNHWLDKWLKEVLMIDYLSIVETEKVIHIVESDIVKLTVEIKSFGKISDEFDKETGSSGGLQPKQADLNFVHALNELHSHEIHVVPNENPIHTLGDYSKPSHEGYRNTIKLPVGNNMVPLRSDTIRVPNHCSSSIGTTRRLLSFSRGIAGFGHNGAKESKVSETITSVSKVETSNSKTSNDKMEMPKIKTVRMSEPIIEELKSDSEEDKIMVKPKEVTKTVKPIFEKFESVNARNETVRQAKNPRKNHKSPREFMIFVDDHGEPDVKLLIDVCGFKNERSITKDKTNSMSVEAA
nr:hypothetical protein [Tanacetum cinerariifolium]